MSIASLEEVAVFDDEGTIEGLQFDSRERAIQEWRDRKEKEEYERLFSRLYQRNWARERRKDPEHRKRHQENLRRHRQRNHKAIRDRENARNRARYEANPVVNTCQECGHTWQVPYGRKGPKSSKFCSTKCRNQDSGRRRKRSRGLRDMTIEPRAMAFIASHPGVTAAQIAEGIGAKANSIRVCVKRWTDEGKLLKTGRKNATYTIKS